MHKHIAMMISKKTRKNSKVSPSSAVKYMLDAQPVAFKYLSYPNISMKKKNQADDCTTSHTDAIIGEA